VGDLGDGPRGCPPFWGVKGFAEGRNASRIRYPLPCPISRSGSATAIHQQGRVVQSLDITIHWANCYPVDSVLPGG